MRPTALPLLLTLIGAAATLASAAPADPLAAVDWPAARAEATGLLVDLLRIDTTNPPGAESAAAEYLDLRLEAEGIPTELHDLGEGRANVIARLPATAPSGEGPLCLVSHLDVASAEAERWSQPPFAGFIDAEGTIWGRGALDMKGMTVVELEAMLLLKRLGLPRTREVILLAVADEEVNNVGMQRLIAERWPSIQCAHAINEGGIGIIDGLFPGQVLFPISVGEKGALWLRVSAEGKAGHGSTPLPDEAPDRLLAALERLRAYEPEPQVHESLNVLFESVGATRQGLERLVFTRPLLQRTVLIRELMKNPLTRAAITDTLHITGLEGAFQPNVVPSVASALLDCRLLPGTSPEAMLARVKALAGDEGLTFTVLNQFAAQVSPWDDPVFEALVRAAEARPNVVAGPAISVGFTDSIFLREVGVRAYGFVPFHLTAEELGTMHGPDERLRAEELEAGVRAMLGVLVGVVGG
ncbi:MAG: M20/M25/M40 family metallo-hydrolase [Deltaproteobacteria bacterium]|nr:M20/M25/M40 family metallo-hydrolase [Deltaproteobacteria bacterium]